jgi:uncharacterized membrane protein (DUF485 family)
MQTRKESVGETILSVGTGFFTAMLLNLYLLPFFVDDITNQVISTAILIGVIYTTVSMIRSYIFRRAFNRFSERYNKSIQGRYTYGDKL